MKWIEHQPVECDAMFRAKFCFAGGGELQGSVCAPGPMSGKEN